MKAQNPSTQNQNTQDKNTQDQNSHRLPYLFLTIVVLQTLFLFYMIGSKQLILSTGTPVLLETAPIDPRSLFSGDYVQLSYAISNLTLEDIPGDKDFKRGDSVYVTLAPDQKGQETTFWKPVSLSKTYPENSAPNVVIRGIANQKSSQALPNSQGIKTILSVWYGIEQYYVPEGEGKALEKSEINRTLSVKIKINSWGTPAIAGLLDNGQEVYQERLF